MSPLPFQYLYYLCFITFGLFYILQVIIFKLLFEAAKTVGSLKSWDRKHNCLSISSYRLKYSCLFTHQAFFIFLFYYAFVLYSPQGSFFQCDAPSLFLNKFLSQRNILVFVLPHKFLLQNLWITPIFSITCHCWIYYFSGHIGDHYINFLAVS